MRGVTYVAVKAGSSRRWKDLSGRQRAAISVGVVIQLALLIGALTDLRRRAPEQVRGPKPLWAALSFVNFVGPLTYFACGRRR